MALDWFPSAEFCLGDLDVDVYQGMKNARMRCHRIWCLSAATNPMERIPSRWDAENRLIQITYPSSGNNSAFTYDSFGRMVKIVETVASSVTSTKQLIQVGRRISEERDGSGALAKQYFRRGQKNGAAQYFYSKDQLGSVREMCDGSGVPQARYSYDPFGRVTEKAISTSSDLGFSGLYQHERSGLNIAMFRLYSPALGRWINLDPLRENGGLNLYVYGANAPVSKVDPTGLACNDFSSDDNDFPPDDEDDWYVPWQEMIIPSYTTEPNITGVHQLPQRRKGPYRTPSPFRKCRKDSDPDCCEDNWAACSTLASIVAAKLDLTSAELKEMLDCCLEKKAKCEKAEEFEKEEWEKCFEKWVKFTDKK